MLPSYCTPCIQLSLAALLPSTHQRAQKLVGRVVNQRFLCVDPAHGLSTNQHPAAGGQELHELPGIGAHSRILAVDLRRAAGRDELVVWSENSL